MLCPCGSSLLFNACCQPLLNNHISHQQAATPEQLMRSRFSAYAIKAGQYIFDTYGAAQQVNLSVADIQSWADECSWIALVIHKVVNDAKEHTVEFSAYYIADNTLCELREKSNFALENNQWRYIDGNISANNELGTIKRNEICPCNNYPTAWSTKKGKKFKHCCGK